MAKKVKEKKILEGVAKFNRISKPMNLLFSFIFLLCALAAVIPLIFCVIISFTDKTSLNKIGFSFFPEKWSLSAYSALWDSKETIIRAFFVSVFITVVGTVVGLLLNATMGYVLSRKSFKLRKLYTWIVFIPMVFSGGMVATFLVITQFLGLEDSVWALILPMAVGSFYVIILRTFFNTTVPDSLIESGKIDGASQLRIFFQIVLPISLPALATIGLFLSFAYWNDWFNALMYLTTDKYAPLQFVLMKIEQNINFMISSQNMDPIARQAMMQMPQEAFRMALVVILVLPIACSYPFFQKYFVSGLTIGAVKG
ncbi:carbohydrate ABC transporter permease [Paludicola sp. MB14-C6]|uniref:carbohydrate ABC transporter permease n=1 Tax=Paludihabitans sp. MB14-C6 TaxID=3070656 RepID=UPI0027DC4D61|nr:carbohydrate ABC transporter permease [Paludicola sp. MB14-C6]WMJ24061.1 carbohydrate ABC transporter permease [Paludicola sp. MB14-C6]